MKQTRRSLLKLIGASTLGSSLKVDVLKAQERMIQRIIPSSGGLLPVIGLGTSRVFDTDFSPELLKPRKEIVQTLLNIGKTSQTHVLLGKKTGDSAFLWLEA